MRKAVLFLIFGLLVLGGCIEKEEVKKISFEDRIYPEIDPETDDVLIAVAGTISPKETYIYYEDVFKYISQKLGKPVRLVQRGTHQAVNTLIEDGQIDAAFVCSGAYIEGHDKFGMVILVAPASHEESEYHSWIIVHQDSEIEGIKGLRGKRFAFTDPISDSGWLAPTYLLSLIGESPTSFFSTYIYTGNHEKSIEAVSEKIVDGAAVDSSTWLYFNETRPSLTSKTKVVNKSQKFSRHPVTVPRSLDPDLKKKLRNIFLHMHEDEKGKEILKKMRVDKFVEIDDSAYDSLREMKGRIKANE